MNKINLFGIECSSVDVKEVLFMKVVVIKSPCFLSGILRMIFKIHKSEEN